MSAEEAALDARLRKRQDYEEETVKIEKFTQEVSDKYRNKITKKIRSLLGNKETTRKTKTCGRKKIDCINNLKQQRIRNQPTVLNISNVPFSSDETDLLSRG